MIRYLIGILLFTQITLAQDTTVNFYHKTRTEPMLISINNAFMRVVDSLKSLIPQKKDSVIFKGKTWRAYRFLIGLMITNPMFMNSQIIISTPGSYTLTDDLTPPSKVQILNVMAISDDSILVTWNDPADGDLAKIEYRWNGVLDSVNKGVEQLYFTGLTAETYYYIDFRARDDSSNWSAWSDTVGVYTLASGTFDYDSTLFVATNGDDADDGSVDKPLKTIARANVIADTSTYYKYIKLRGGDIFREELTAKSNKYYCSYGTGQAMVENSTYAAYVRAKDNVVIDNIRFDGRVLVRNVDGLVIKDCNVYGLDGSRNNVGGIQIQGILEDIVRIERCTVKNFAEGIRVYGMAQSDLTNLDSLVIDACVVDSCYRDDDNYDGIRLIGNELLASIDYGYKAVIRNCTVTNWGEDAIDIAFASNVIVEKNILHDNRTPNIYDTESSGIKAGEQTAGTTLKGSTGNIIRYNKIYNINRPSNSSYYSCRGIGVARTNDILIHHNVIYNVRGYGIYRPATNTVDKDAGYIVKIYNNTISVDTSCVIIPTGGNDMRTYIKNNIFITKGNNNTIFAQEDTRIGKNVFVKRGGVYEGTTTRTSAAVWQKYNDVDSSSTSYYGIDSTALFPGAGDYEITTTSYTGEDLDLGYDIEGNAVDGTNPDCGAYEYDGSYFWLLLGLRRRRKHA